MIALARRTLHAALAGGLAAAVVWTAGVPAEAAVAATVSVRYSPNRSGRSHPPTSASGSPGTARVRTSPTTPTTPSTATGCAL